eukprot:TRINITY_DN1557_c0_g1_i1.p1 TRINITY_DN1557_c0_g1~~TRINITY_DN1557_c0_g1_i1.p1  ORF type:complete len:102 (-),score=2.98 TRINITY_DN1557_c0_g1_i1:111-416(-)
MQLAIWIILLTIVHLSMLSATSCSRTEPVWTADVSLDCIKSFSQYFMRSGVCGIHCEDHPLFGPVCLVCGNENQVLLGRNISQMMGCESTPFRRVLQDCIL